ncbi:hypothetical protein ACFOLA_11315 [Salinicoccus hispanicus]|uniref:Uncharacterized protein n=1 Tax=Salinicoccus hispanicus TaxID=157225 RepID=A0A6N8TY84_9STAP|nr:hypothetical protein [Salinicoccus hispanicus]MXQ50938.1 hypothetical protein [Salinicoccus hispanicus]
MNREFQSKPFILSKRALVNVQNDFDHVEALSSAHLYYDDKTEVTDSSNHGIRILLIGYILDITDGNRSSSEILTELCQLYQSENKESFYEKLDFLNGRYILIADDGSDTVLFTDATCLRPVFYWNKEILGSHEVLVREVVEGENNIELSVQKFKMNGFLDYTSTQSVYKMNPNVFYSAVGMQFIRYYPRAQSKVSEVDEIVAKTIDFYQPQVEWLNRNYPLIYQSLTGGYDSKISLAITKPTMNKVQYFTYMIDLENTPDSQFSRIYRKDKDLVDRLVYNLNIDDNHTYYYFNEYPLPKDYEKTISRNTSSSHSYVLSHLTHREFEKNSIHVKSTIYEIAKLPFSANHINAQTDEELLNVIVNWAPKTLRKEPEKLLDMYRSFAERVDMEQVALYGYNLPVMLYWETRMGNWHSNITQETDNVLETFVFVNNRHMLNQFMYLDTQARKNRTYFDKVVSNKWPILNYFIPNRYETLEDRIAMQANDGASQTRGSASRARVELTHYGINVRDISNLEVAAQADHIEIRPLQGTKLKDEEITLTLANNDESDKPLVLEGYYNHPSKNIFIALNGEKFSINDYHEGKNVTLKAGEEMKISYHYAKNFDRSSWYKAGMLTIR